MSFPFASLIQLLIVVAAAMAGVWLLVKLFMGLGWAMGQLFRGVGAGCSRIGAFVGGMVSDSLRIVGGVITAAFFVPFIVTNIALGRWSTANHYGRALEQETVGVAKASYRVCLGHIAQLFGLSSLTEGIERRIPDAVARAPGPDAPHRRPDAFDGYTVVGSLPSGGSGARLYLAEATRPKRDQLAKGGVVCPARVVIKSFSMADGSTMPQIVRESRALEAARKLGLVLEHELTSSRFHYVMPYVPGEDLSLVTRRLHDESGGAGLGDKQLGAAIGFSADLLQIMHRFHMHGLWHKDIKPSNIIVSDGRVHLVDLGLTTPLRSAMTLTTHGTEYFRDPELVRLALRGVKVHEVDGVKFDIYGAGAVLYSIIENSFPAHGSLSQIRRRCPEALRWIVRRAMADMNNRYASAVEMLADLRTVMAARDPFKVAPAQLPSVSGRPDLVEAVTASLAASGSEAFGPGPLPPAPAQLAKGHGEQPRRREEIAASSRKGGLRWGAAAAAAVLLLGVTGAVGMFLLAPGHTLRLDHSNPPAPVMRDHAQASQADFWNLSLDALRKRLPSEATLAERRPLPSRLLVVDDVPAGSDLRQGLGTLFKLLGIARFDVAGASGELTDDDIGLIAEARKLIGLGSPADPEIRARLDALLAEHADVIDALLWLGRNEDDPRRMTYQSVAARELDAADLSAILEPARKGKTPPQQAGQGDAVVYRIY